MHRAEHAPEQINALTRKLTGNKQPLCSFTMINQLIDSVKRCVWTAERVRELRCSVCCWITASLKILQSFHHS